MGFGSILNLGSLYEMSKWTPDIAPIHLITTTLIQGVGMGFVFIPMNIIAFATLPGQYRTDASALMNLVRNVGSAIGISVTTTVLAASMQILHSQIGSHVSVFNRALDVNSQSMMWNPRIPFGLESIDAVVNHNAAVIAYANDFLFMFYISLPTLLVIALMKKPDMMPQKSTFEALE
jgi:DHA2 family multidrug resistance protein